MFCVPCFVLLASNLILVLSVCVCCFEITCIMFCVTFHLFSSYFVLCSLCSAFLFLVTFGALPVRSFTCPRSFLPILRSTTFHFPCYLCCCFKSIVTCVLCPLPPCLITFITTCYISLFPLVLLRIYSSLLMLRVLLPVCAPFRSLLSLLLVVFLRSLLSLLLLYLPSLLPVLRTTSFYFSLLLLLLL